MGKSMPPKGLWRTLDLVEDAQLNFDDGNDSSLLTPDVNDPIRRQLLQAGEHLFYLKVTDAGGKTDVDTARTVRDVPPSILDVTAVGQVGDTTAANVVDGVPNSPLTFK